MNFSPRRASSWLELSGSTTKRRASLQSIRVLQAPPLGHKRYWTQFTLCRCRLAHQFPPSVVQRRIQSCHMRQGVAGLGTSGFSKISVAQIYNYQYWRSQAPLVRGAAALRGDVRRSVLQIPADNFGTSSHPWYVRSKPMPSLCSNSPVVSTLPTKALANVSHLSQKLLLPVSDITTRITEQPWSPQ